MRCRQAFRTQLTVIIALIVLVTVALISLLSNIFINLEFEKYAKEQQETHALDIAVNLSNPYNSLTAKWNTEYIHGVGMSALTDGYMIRLSDLRGEVVWDAENHDMTLCSQVMMEIIERMEEKRPSLNGSFVSREYDLEQNGQKIGTVVIQSYGPYFLSESEFRFLDSLNLVLIIIGSLALFFSIFMAGLLAKRVSGPVMKTAHIATQIAEGNYKIRFEGNIKTRELDELMAAMNHMAQSLDRQESLRKRLTTDVAHELRTPLTALSSHLEAMIEGVWEPTSERLQSCYEEIGRITGLVTELEKLRQVESNQLKLEKSPVDLLELFRSVSGNFERESEKKGIALSVEGESSVVPADRSKMTQVFTNLLSNAIKYTPESGQIRITIKDTPKSGIATVSDSGIGIPKDELSLIFERFYRTDKSRNRQTGGAGIGLTIAKSIVLAHGGRIEVVSKAGQGSQFTVTSQSEFEHGSCFIVTLPKNVY